MYIEIDEKMINTAMKLAKVKSKKDVVNLALQEFVENRPRLNLLDLAGKIKFSENYNYKRLYNEKRK